MQTSRVISSQPGRLQALVARHTALKEQIEQEMKHPAYNAEIVRTLKSEKLKLKDEIELERQRA